MDARREVLRSCGLTRLLEAGVRTGASEGQKVSFTVHSSQPARHGGTWLVPPSARKPASQRTAGVASARLQRLRHVGRAVRAVERQCCLLACK